MTKSRARVIVYGGVFVVGVIFLIGLTIETKRPHWKLGFDLSRRWKLGANEIYYNTQDPASPEHIIHYHLGKITLTH
jgi:hypothetical protein